MKQFEAPAEDDAPVNDHKNKESTSNSRKPDINDLKNKFLKKNK
jgi:hypothetical protein